MKLMELSSTIIDELKDSEMILVTGGNKPVQSSNNSSGICSGTNNADGKCEGTNNGTGLCKDD